jgi:hypothetical protein
LLTQSSVHEDEDVRKDTARAIGQAYSPKGGAILLAMLADENPEVKQQVIEALDASQDAAMLAHLQPFISHAQRSIREAAIMAMIEIAAPQSLAFLQQTARDAQMKTPIRIAAIKALGAIGAQEAIAFLVNTLRDESDASYHPAVMAALGQARSSNALKPLQEYLGEQEARRRAWRAIRDREIEGYTDEQYAQWQAALNEVAPQTYLEFNLGCAIAQIDAETGVTLLRHDLINARQGAWLGLARRPLTDTRPFHLIDGAAAVKLIERLERERLEQQAQDPLFSHAAYRAIDEMLITIEAYGDAADLQHLEAFFQKVQDAVEKQSEDEKKEREGVLTRVEWTIERLRERQHGETLTEK